MAHWDVWGLCIHMSRFFCHQLGPPNLILKVRSALHIFRRLMVHLVLSLEMERISNNAVLLLVDLGISKAYGLH
jgi:hypothetical protein